MEGKDTEKILTVDKAQVEEAFRKAISEQVTAALREATTLHDIKDLVKEAFLKRWRDDRNTWIEQEAQGAFQRALFTAMQEAFEKSGINGMLLQAIKEYIASPEYKETIRQRAIQAVNKTTFYIRPEKDEAGEL